MTDKQHPTLTTKGSEPDRRALYVTLRERWLKVEAPVVNPQTGEPEHRSVRLLASLLGTPKQACTQWATGSGDREPPPWWVVLWLCNELGLGVAIDPRSGVRLYPLD